MSVSENLSPVLTSGISAPSTLLKPTSQKIQGLLSSGLPSFSKLFQSSCFIPYFSFCCGQSRTRTCKARQAIGIPVFRLRDWTFSETSYANPRQYVNASANFAICPNNVATFRSLMRLTELRYHVLQTSCPQCVATIKKRWDVISVVTRFSTHPTILTNGSIPPRK